MRLRTRSSSANRSSFERLSAVSARSRSRPRAANILRAASAAATRTSATLDTNHQRRQKGGITLKETTAGLGLAAPSASSARTMKRYEPGARFAKLTERWSEGAPQVE